MIRQNVLRGSYFMTCAKSILLRFMHHARLSKPGSIANVQIDIQIVDTPDWFIKSTPLARWPKCPSAHAGPSPVSSNATPKKGKVNASAVGTLVDRTNRLLLLIKLSDIQTSGAANVLQGFTDKLLNIAQALRQSMTDDQGRKMAMDKPLSQNTGIGMYFCDPHSPWQRGSNENMNALVRH
jgi:hypothetical protein